MDDIYGIIDGVRLGLGKAVVPVHLVSKIADIEIVDLAREPGRALSDAVYLTPTLIKLAPEPQAQVVGSLNNMSLLLDVLELERKT